MLMSVALVLVHLACACHWSHHRTYARILPNISLGRMASIALWLMIPRNWSTEKRFWPRSGFLYPSLVMAPCYSSSCGVLRPSGFLGGSICTLWVTGSLKWNMLRTNILFWLHHCTALEVLERNHECTPKITMCPIRTRHGYFTVLRFIFRFWWFEKRITVLNKFPLNDAEKSKSIMHKLVNNYCFSLCWNEGVLRWISWKLMRNS